jgi:ParB-like chromosome segregation protein Spo0J
MKSLARSSAVQSDDQLRREPGQRLEVHRHLATYRVDELHPHPSYVRHQLTVPASKLSALAERGDLGFQEPLLITREGTILDGYARWELARLQGRLTLPCIEYELTEADALRWLLDTHRRSKGLNDFIRVLLALELEPLLKEKARSNQQAGGRTKGSSKLTEAERTDVRSQIATAAGVSVGNVTKVKQLVGSGHPDLLEALRGSEVSIHRAWKWSKESAGRQIEALRTYRNTRGVSKAIRDLVARHKPNSPATPDLMSLVKRLSKCKTQDCTSVNVALIRVPGKTIFVTEELMRSLPPYQESIPICTADNR